MKYTPLDWAKMSESYFSGWEAAMKLLNPEKSGSSVGDFEERIASIEEEIKFSRSLYRELKEMGVLNNEISGELEECVHCDESRLPQRDEK